MKYRLYLANPLLIYTLIWLLSLLLVNLRLTTNLLPINLSTVILIFSNIISFWLIYFTLSSTDLNSKKQGTIPPYTVAKLNRFAKKLLIIWMFGTTLEIIYGRGVPLIWIFQGVNKNYASFGIPTFHGIMNSLYLFSQTALWLDYLVRKKSKTLWLIIGLLGWPVMALGRSLLMSLIFQMIAVYLILKKLNLTDLFKLKNLLKLGVLTLSIIIGFGYLGDLRGHQNALEYLINRPSGEVFTYLPSGFLWVYVYATSPINNIIANIINIEPSYIPYNSISNLLPTALRVIIFPELNYGSLELVDKNLTVSTFYAGYLYDFGIIGSIIIVCVLQIIVTILYLRAKTLKVWAILAYSVLFQCVVFSIFYDLFLLLPYIAQIIIALYFRAQVRVGKTNKRKVESSSL